MSGFVAHFQIQPSFIHRGVHAQRRVAGRLRKILFRVPMAFYDGQRRVQKQPKEQIAQLAQSAAARGLQPAIQLGQRALVRRYAIRVPHQLPEGKRFARANRHAL